MRILYHHRTLGDGAEGIHIREMVNAFRALGHEVRVIGPVGEASPQGGGRPKLLGSIKQALPSALFEVIEVGYTLVAFLSALSAILRFRPDFVYDRYIIFNAGTVLAAKVLRVPVLLEVNAPLALERSEERDETLAFRKLAHFIERWTCSNASHTIVVSTPLKNYLASVGVPGDKCVVMPNGVDPDRFVPRAVCHSLLTELGIPPDAFVVGFTGILRPWHGLNLLVDAVARMAHEGRAVFLLIVGDGPYRGELESMLEVAGLAGASRITGRVNHARVPDFVSLFGVAVSPRATFYASPMKVIEYMSLSIPVVVPRTPNFLDIIDEDHNGITFEDGSSAALQAALTYLYDSPAQRQRIGRNGRNKVLSRLNWRWNAARCCEMARAGA
jgi:glycosyltransferase involved in cell wall biosynthesis